MQKNSVLKAIVLPAVAGLLILIVLVGTVLRISTSRSDSLALARQDRLVSVAIRQSFTSIANDQEASTLWDDAVVRLHKRPLDYVWIDNNLGVWFHTFYQHDEAYLLDPRNNAIYAMGAGRRARVETFKGLPAKVRPMIARLRQELLSGSEAPAGSSGQTKGEADLGVVAGHPAIISIKPIVPETDAVTQAAGDEYLHISVRYLDGSYLAGLQSKYGIDGARFSLKPSKTASFMLADRSGARIGYIVWNPFQPGTQVASRMAPALLAALCLIGCTLIILLSQRRRNRLRLEETNAEIEHLAYHDALTGLPNRAAFRTRLEAALSETEGKSQLAVLLADLDRFKLINDAFGHPAGDAVICAFAKKLTALVQPPSLVARLGGDEFAIILAGKVDVRALCGKIQAAASEPCEFDGQMLHIGVSIGIAFATQTSSEGEELLRKADIALYRAKADGRNRSRFFDHRMDEDVRLRARIEDELRGAMQRSDELGVFFQPIFVPHNDRPVGFEALLRWHQKGCAAWTADQFITVAEDSGLILSLGEWVMRNACEATLKLKHSFVSVNLSPLQCRSLEFVVGLLKIIKDSGANPGQLQIEITERALLDGGEESLAAIATLRAAGLKIVLEDFGTGYSSLKHLRSDQFDKLKVDRSLVHHLGEESQASELVAAVCGLGRVIGLTMAAEGVESVQQRDLLIAAGCSEMQGHLFSAAVPIEGAVRLLEQLPPAATA
jgi:diguanylate cyclase (GGDEF)-like protein